MQSSDNFTILAGARPSPLSLAQTHEVECEMQKHFPHLHLQIVEIVTLGDRDQMTSLRHMEKTDFFTKDIDEALLAGKCRIAIHSAKDLPEPLPEGIELIALTEGVDNSDSLVLKEGISITELPAGAKIATSSIRREESIRALRKDLDFIDVRGTIHQRLALLDQNLADGVVIAEAALIRLGLTHLNRIHLKAETAPLQGRLAITARKGDTEMEELFACIDARKVFLHVGLKSGESPSIDVKALHCPMIETRLRNFNEPAISEAFQKFNEYTHIIFTSQTAVHGCILALKGTDLLDGKQLIAVGKATGDAIASYGLSATVATEPTAEGVCTLMDKMPLEGCHIFWPRSAQARPIIADYLHDRGVDACICDLYDTVPIVPEEKPELNSIARVYFTSPSTVEAFFLCYGCFPKHIQYDCIGSVTQETLKSKLLQNSVR